MKKKVYEAPVVEVLEARIEKGFVGSGTADDTPRGTEPLTEGETYQFS